MDNDPFFTLTDHVWRDEEGELHDELNSTLDSPKRYAFGHFGTQVRLEDPDGFFSHRLYPTYMSHLEKRPPLLMEVWEDQIYSRWDHYWDVQFAYFKQNLSFISYGECYSIFMFLDLDPSQEMYHSFDINSMHSLMRRGKETIREKVKGINTVFRTITSEAMVYLLDHVCDVFPNLQAFSSNHKITDLEVDSLLHFINSCQDLEEIEVDIKALSLDNQINFYKHIQKHKNYKKISSTTRYSLDFKSLYFNSKSDAALFVGRLSGDEVLRVFVMSLGDNYRSLLKVKDGDFYSTIFWELDEEVQLTLAGFENS